jgi:hypothetical protein
MRSSSRNNAIASALKERRRALTTRVFAGMAVPSSIGEQTRRPDALRHRRLGVEIKLTHETGHSESGIALDADTRVRTQAAFSPGQCEPFAFELLARLLRSVPVLTCELQ